MRVGILGPLEVVAGGQKIDSGGARLRTLLIRLALDAGRTVAAAALADAVWPDGGPEDRVNALQSLVARLRRALPDDLLLSARGGYRLAVAADAVDAHRFERLAGEGRRALKDGEPEIAARLLGEGLALWRGEIPGEIPDAARRRLEELRLTAREDRVEAALALDHLDGLVAELEELTAAYPFRERLRGLLIKALNAEGRDSEALTTYERFRAFLAEELGADPGPRLQEVHLAALRGETVLTRPRGNLRSAVTSFVGRAGEVACVRRRLSASRLVTLVGPGGVGKTRLATAVAADGPDGAWLVELTPVTDAGAVVRTMSDALGIREGSWSKTSRDPMDRLTEALKGDDTLVVLDNCEHVIDEVARLTAELLGRCPGLRVIATSREPLGIPGEVICAVPPLEPESAVRLFGDRAAAVRPGFVVTDDNVGVVGEICRRLDRLPLAVELAAARLRSLPLADLAARLGGSLELLARADRRAEPRHRTLRAVIAWSWDLLDDGEGLVAGRLAAFPGGITVESAESVAAADIDVLAALADRSLLQFDGERYWMLETIREYGFEELVKSGELGRIRAAHAAYFVGLAERAEPYLRGAGQLSWIARLAAERDNLLAALRSTRDTGDAGAALRLCAALGVFWMIRGDHHAMASWSRLALEIPGEAPVEARAVAATLCLLATGPWIGQEVNGAAVEEIWGLIAKSEPEAAHPLVALIEPFLAFAGDDVAAALAPVDRRLSHPDAWTRAVVRLMRAIAQGTAGDLEGMRDDLEMAVAGFRAVGERGGLAWSLTSLADLQTTLGEFDGAIAGLEEAVRLLRELDPADGAVLQRVWIAEARSRTGDAGRARAELVQLMRTDAGALPAGHSVFARMTLGDLARREGDLPEATRQLRLAREELDGSHHLEPVYRVTLGCAVADLAMDQHDPDGAWRHVAEAFDAAVSARDMTLAAIVAAHLARLWSLRGHAAVAVELLGAAHALIGYLEALDREYVLLALRLREELGERAYEAAYARGRDPDHDDVLAVIRARLA